MKPNSSQMLWQNERRTLGFRVWIVAFLAGWIAIGTRIGSFPPSGLPGTSYWDSVFGWSILVSFVLSWTTFDTLFRHPHARILLRLPIPSSSWVHFAVLRTFGPTLLVCLLLLLSLPSNTSIQTAERVAQHVALSFGIPFVSVGLSLLTYTYALQSLDGTNPINPILSKGLRS